MIDIHKAIDELFRYGRKIVTLKRIALRHTSRCARPRKYRTKVRYEMDGQNYTARQIKAFADRIRPDKLTTYRPISALF